MIRFTLRCDQDHRFDSWFQSSEAYEKLRAAGMIACTICGAKQVEKALMAPRVRPGGDAAASPVGALTAPASPAEQALTALRQHIEANSDYVGLNFAAQARAMHDGTTPERPIYGEARADEARRLIEDGIPVTPLPFVPARKTN